MTLRCTLEIVPHGMEEHKVEIFRADISNIGTVRHEGFGHEICKYKYVIYKQIPPALQKDGETLDKYTEGFIEEHDRRDGPWRLVSKVVEDFET